MACPFFKYDPDKYKTERTCPGPGWDDVHRVKFVATSTIDCTSHFNADDFTTGSTYIGVIDKLSIAVADAGRIFRMKSI
jgi:hypothetical protein